MNDEVKVVELGLPAQKPLYPLGLGYQNRRVSRTPGSLNHRKVNLCHLLNGLDHLLYRVAMAIST